MRRCTDPQTALRELLDERFGPATPALLHEAIVKPLPPPRKRPVPPPAAAEHLRHLAEALPWHSTG